MKRCRLIYRSIASQDVLDSTRLSQLVNQSAANNERQGITGLLLLSGDRFLQVLEGPVKFVNELYAKIINDDRHRAVELISYEPMGTAFFYDWSMRIISLDDTLDKQLRKSLEEKYAEEEGQIQIPDDLMRVYALLLDARWGLLSNHVKV